MTGSSSSPEKKLKMADFMKKYESQRIKWEKIRNSPPAPKELTEEEIKEMAEETFKPVINNRSKQLTQNMTKLENRLTTLTFNKMKLMNEIEQAQPQYLFRPQINERSEKLAAERKKAQ